MRLFNRNKKIFLMAVAAVMIFTTITTPSSAITWGYADGEQHPNVCALMGFYEGWGWVPFCSGTLIDKQIVLTAGHCTAGLSQDLVYISFDEDPTLEGAERLEVAGVITHPEYRRAKSNPYDVGAIILKEPVETKTPAKVANIGYLDELLEAGLLRQGKEEADFTVVGYGATLLFPPPGILYEDKRQYSYSEYQTLLKSWLRLSQNQATGDGGSSYGDSGGPAFWETNGSEVLVGITSWGDVPCVATAFCYRADTKDTHDLIALAEAWLNGKEN